MAGKATYISTDTTTTVSTVPCNMIRVVVGQTAAGAIKFFDDGSGTATQVGELKSSITEGQYDFDISLKNGLTVVTAAASKITVVTE